MNDSFPPTLFPSHNVFVRSNGLTESMSFITHYVTSTSLTRPTSSLMGHKSMSALLSRCGSEETIKERSLVVQHTKSSSDRSPKMKQSTTSEPKAAQRVLYLMALSIIALQGALWLVPGTGYWRTIGERLLDSRLELPQLDSTTLPGD